MSHTTTSASREKPYTAQTERRLRKRVNQHLGMQRLPRREIELAAFRTLPFKIQKEIAAAGRDHSRHPKTLVGGLEELGYNVGYVVDTNRGKQTHFISLPTEATLRDRVREILEKNQINPKKLVSSKLIQREDGQLYDQISWLAYRNHKKRNAGAGLRDLGFYTHQKWGDTGKALAWIRRHIPRGLITRLQAGHLSEYDTLIDAIHAPVNQSANNYLRSKHVPIDEIVDRLVRSPKGSLTTQVHAWNTQRATYFLCENFRTGAKMTQTALMHRNPKLVNFIRTHPFADTPDEYLPKRMKRSERALLDQGTRFSRNARYLMRSMGHRFLQHGDFTPGNRSIVHTSRIVEMAAAVIFEVARRYDPRLQEITALSDLTNHEILGFDPMYRRQHNQLAPGTGGGKDYADGRAYLGIGSAAIEAKAGERAVDRLITDIEAYDGTIWADQGASPVEKWGILASLEVPTTEQARFITNEGWKVIEGRQFLAAAEQAFNILSRENGYIWDQIDMPITLGKTGSHLRALEDVIMRFGMITSATNAHQCGWAYEAYRRLCKQFINEEPREGRSDGFLPPFHQRIQIFGGHELSEAQIRYGRKLDLNFPGTIALDLEVPGYAKKGAPIINAVVLKDGAIDVYYARNPLQERELLVELNNLVASHRVLTWNGDSADLYWLRYRTQAHRMQYQEPKESLDLLKWYRGVRKSKFDLNSKKLHGKRLSLGAFEEDILRYTRTDKIPAVQIFKQYRLSVGRGQHRGIAGIIDRCMDDVISLGLAYQIYQEDHGMNEYFGAF